MAKQIYIDENGNENLVSGTINTGKMLPMSTTEPTSMVADRIEALEYNDGDTFNASISKYCSGRTTSAGDKVVFFYPLSNTVKTNSSTLTISTDSNCWRSDGAPITLSSGTYSGAVTDGGLYFIVNLSSTATGNRAVNVELVTRTLTFVNA